MASFRRDLAHGARTLRKSPGFATTAILTIALGIGATTAIFSVVNTVLLRPLPYAEPDRLVLIQNDLSARNVIDFPIAPADFNDIREQGTLFESVAGIVTFRQAFTAEGADPIQIKAAGVTTNFLATLGLRTILGRGFIEADGAVAAPPPSGAPATQVLPQANAMVVLTHGFWRRQYGGDSSVIGRTMRLGGQVGAIVGVLEPGVRFLWPAANGIEPDPDYLVAMRFNFANESPAARMNVFVRAVARLKPATGLEQARAQIQVINQDLLRRFPLKVTAGVRLRVEPMRQDLVNEIKPGLLALMGAVVFVLLIACANVANLLLVRSAQRERELVVRAALGASRADLIRQMLAESLLIAGGGAVLGVGLAFGGLGLLRAFAPPHLPRIAEVNIDVIVLAFTMLMALLSAVVFGVLPALRASRPDAGAALRTATRTGGLAAGRALRNGVVVAEVALAFVLLVGSGLMVRSMMALYRAYPGFDPHGILTFQALPTGLNNPGLRQSFARDLRSRLQALPGVLAVAAGNPLPLDGEINNARWGTAEAVADPAKFQQTDVHFVQVGYFEVLKTRLLEGRVFTEADNDTNRTAIVIDRVMAAKAYPGQSAVGQRLLVRLRSSEPEWLDIIGVVEHQRNVSLAADGREAIFVPEGFVGFGPANRWMVRTSGDPMDLANAVRGEVRRFSPGTPVSGVQPMTALIDRSMAPTRFALVAIGTFGAVAAILAVVGLYGVLSTTVRQRTAEIGIRMVFGAEQGSIFRLVVGQGLRLSAAGIVAGLVAALALTRVMTSMLVGVRPTDPATLAGIAALFIVVAAVACFVPARRAAGLDPAAALREE